MAVSLPNGIQITRDPRRRRVNAAYIADLTAYAQLLFKGGLAPKDVNRPEQVAAMIEVGRDLGLSDTQAIQSVKIVAGRPSIYGDSALALIRASGMLADFEEGMTQDDDGATVGAWCRSVRQAGRELRTEFTIADAERAGLWGKKGPWQDYPKRMLAFRARGFNLRDNFGDVLCGLITTEEARDMPFVTEEQAAVLAQLEPVTVQVDPPAVAEATTAEPVAEAIANRDTPTTGQPAENIAGLDSVSEALDKPAAEPPPTEEPSPVTAKQLEEFAKLFPLVAAAHCPNGDEDEQAAAWGEALFGFTGKRSARQLTSREATAALETMGEKYDPFVIPPKPEAKGRKKAAATS